MESDYTSANLATLADLTNWAHSLGKIVAVALYTKTQWWHSLLKQTSNFNWWNPQLYGRADYGEWVQGLTFNPQSFLTYGYKPDDGWSPAEILTALQETRKQYAGLSGAFLWRYEDIRTKLVRMGWAVKTD